MATPRSASKSNRKGPNSPLREAIRNIVTASGQTSRQRNGVQLTLDIQTVEAKAKESGLPAQYFVKIIDVAASKKLAESASSKLIKSLIPETAVPQEAVVKAVSWMCTNIPSINTQALLIRWINLVFDSIDGKEKLHSLYGILFYFLDSDTLMPHVCHLLYQLTQREDVRLFRVRHLLTLQAAVGPQPYLIGLLSLYKLFYPNLVTIAIPRQRRIFFRQTDHTWAAEIRRVKEKNRSLDEVAVDMDTTRLLVDQSLSSSGRAAKRPRFEIPGISTKTHIEKRPESSNVHTSLDRTPVPFSHIKDFTELAENIEIVEMPGQIATVLQNPLLQHAVSCQRSPITAARFSMWLQHALLEEFINSPDVSEKKQKEQLLNLILKYSNFLQEGIPACERFLERFLASWNGQDFKKHVFELIAKYRMCPFGRLKENILEPIRCLFFNSSVYFKCQVILSLTNLLSNYITVEWKRYTSKSREDNSDGGAPPTEKQYTCLFEEEVEEFQPRDTIRHLVTFIDCMCCIGLLVEPENSLLMNFILAFYERVCTLYKYSVPMVCLPSPGIFYQALFGINAMSLSRICALICLYKESFSAVKSWALPMSSEDIGTDQIDQFNIYLTDIATSLWQYKAFQSPRPESAFNVDVQLLQTLDIIHPNEYLSIHGQQALLGFVIMFLEETQAEGSVVHPNSIKTSQNTKQIYLRFLQKMDVQGIADFIRSFIRKRSRGTGDATSEVTAGDL